MNSDNLQQLAFILLGFVFLITIPPIFAQGKSGPSNHTPVVKIMKPEASAKIRWGDFIRYAIKVSDQEDGETKFQEIPTDEVFLKVTYLPNASVDKQKEEQVMEMDSLGLTVIKESNCLNCHNFKSKSLGPSFAAVAKRYQDTDSNISTLEDHIRQGSSGIWGSAPMPSHSELTEKELESIVHWIMNQAGDSKINYYTGTEGSFKMVSPEKPGTHAGLELSASYIDHGVPDQPESRLKSLDTIILYGE